MKALLEGEQRFWNFVNARQEIWFRRNMGMPKPWTDDPILRKYKFTNVFRELDKDTMWCRRNIRTPLDRNRTYDLLLFNVALFRQTGGTEGWRGIVYDWDWDRCATLYEDAKARGLKTFTGAYMVTGRFPNARGLSKVRSLFKYALQPVWDARKELVQLCKRERSLEALTTALAEFQGWGGNRFMAYEVACDLLHTSLLEGAVDQHTWANPGPGAQRGLCRIYDSPLTMKRGARSRGYEASILEMKSLLEQAHSGAVSNELRFSTGYEFDMRAVEQSLCEFDKYERVRLGEGTPRSLYNGEADGTQGKER